MRAPLIAAGVAATALAGWLVFPRGETGRKASAATTAHHDEAGERLLAMNERLSVLEREREVSARRAAGEATPPADAGAPAAAAADHAAPQRPPPRTGDEAFRGLEAHFGREAKDPTWSAQAEASIAGAFRSEALAGSTILHAACGTTLCRVDVAHDSATAQEGFVWSVRSVPPFSQGGFAHRVDDPASGTSRTIVYVMREGHELPSPGAG